MRIRRILSLPYRYKPWRPSHLRLTWADLLAPASQPVREHGPHLEAAINWLCRAQDVRNHCHDAGGVSAGWNFEDGWLPSYPETSGYIIETLLAASRLLNRPELIARAQRIVDWELSLQHPDGAFPGHYGEPGSRPVIFNTGQIMHGMLAGYLELGRKECLEAAVRAGHWLVRHQDDDGCWRRSELNDIPHTYNTRATWALLRTGLVSGERTLSAAAIRNFDWALAQQTSSGWFGNNAFTAGAAPFTHNIAYAIRGLLEGGILLGDDRLIAAATLAAQGVARRQREDGWLAGTYADGWRPAGKYYCCLTGVAQMAGIWTRLSRMQAAPDFDRAVERALGFLKRNQRITGQGDPSDGALAGSVPIWGRYAMFEFPNWATKFFADVLMMNMEDITIPPPDRTAAARLRVEARAVCHMTRENPD